MGHEGEEGELGGREGRGRGKRARMRAGRGEAAHGKIADGARLPPARDRGRRGETTQCSFHPGFKSWETTPDQFHRGETILLSFLPISCKTLMCHYIKCW